MDYKKWVKLSIQERFYLLEQRFNYDFDLQQRASIITDAVFAKREDFYEQAIKDLEQYQREYDIYTSEDND